MKMVRRIFQLPTEDAVWLDEEARRRSAPVAGLLREYVRLQRVKQEGPHTYGKFVEVDATPTEFAKMSPVQRQRLMDGDWSLK